MHIFCLLAIPMYGHELARAIIWSPAYLIGRLQVLAQKIAHPLWECLLLFIPSCKMSTSNPANCDDIVTELHPQQGCCVPLAAYRKETLSAFAISRLCTWHPSNILRRCLHMKEAVVTVCVLQNSPDFLVRSLPLALTAC